MHFKRYIFILCGKKFRFIDTLTFFTGTWKIGLVMYKYKDDDRKGIIIYASIANAETSLNNCDVLSAHRVANPHT